MSNENAIANAVAMDEKPSGSLATEELFGLTELTKRLPKINGKRPAVCTLWRWCLKGLHGVRLEHVRRGRTLATSLQAVDRFSTALAAARVEALKEQADLPVPQVPRTSRVNPTARQRQIDDAKKRLKEAGF